MNPSLFVVMGVCGSGKTVIGAALALALDLEFVEGDEYHSAENLARMRAGIPLTDDERAGWLRSLAARLAEARGKGSGLAMACSALKRSYRDVLRTASPDVRFVYLRASRSLVAQRVARREGHFMPASLIDSQFEALEEPSPDENAWVVEASEETHVLVARLVARSQGMTAAVSD